MGNSRDMSVERPDYPTQSSQPTVPLDPGRQVSGPEDWQEPDAGPGQFPGSPQPGSPAETAGLVRGLQVWMADLDRRLSIRTKLLLGLVAIAIGAAGAAIFLSVEANRTSASQEEFAELKQQVEQLQEQLGVVPSESELDDAAEDLQGATEEAESSADEAEAAAGEAESAAGDADSAAHDAESATGGAAGKTGGAGGETGGASGSGGSADDPAAVIEEAMKERFDELSEGPPMPKIGSN